MKPVPSIMSKTNAVCTEHGETSASSFFKDTSVVYTDTHIVKERRQDVGGRTFVVNSVFDRFATKTAEDKLKSFVEIEAEREVRKAV